MNWRNIIFVILPILLFGNIYTHHVIENAGHLLFISLSLTSLSFFLLNSFIFKKTTAFNFLDITWWVLIGWMFCSYLWATDPTLVLYYSFGWTALLLYTYVLRFWEKNDQTKQIVQWVLIGLFVITLINSLAVTMDGVIFRKSNIGLHRNIVSVYLLALFSFLLFKKSNSVVFRIFKVSSFVLLTYLFIQTNCRGAIVALIGLIGFYGLLHIKLKQFKIKWRLLVFALISVVVIFCIPGVNQEIQESRIVKEFGDVNELDRFYMLRNSYWIFIEKPLLGVGFGNWELEAYKYGIEDFSYANSKLDFRTQEIHNLYGKFLGELGIIGFVSLLIVLIWPLIQTLRNPIEKSPFELACAGCVLVFIISSLFFGSTIFYQGNFAATQFLLFLSLAFLFPRSGQITSNFQVKNIALTLISVLTVLWFVFYYQSEIEMRQINRLKRTPEKYIIAAEKAYRPKLKSQYKKQSIPTNLARSSSQTANDNRTLMYYERAIAIAPNNVELLNEYANFLLIKNINWELAESLVEKALSIHKDFYRSNLLMARIELNRHNHELALKYLSFSQNIKRILDRLKTQQPRLNMDPSDRVQRNKDELVKIVVEADSLLIQINEEIKL